jgi:AcrR family transcriptional regulator
VSTAAGVAQAPPTTVPPTTVPPTTKPLRRDAAHNRTLLLDAASEVFARRGLDAGVEEIAREAGVGMGTLYRRFPTKQALIDELIGQLRRDLMGLTRAAAAEPAGHGFEALFIAVGRLQAAQPGCVQRLWNHSAAGLDALTEFRRMLAELLAQAQATGVIRADVTDTDAMMLLWSLRDIISATREVAPQAWRRYLELALAGLRAGEHEPLQTKPLTAAQARRISAIN